MFLFFFPPINDCFPFGQSMAMFERALLLNKKPNMPHKKAVIFSRARGRTADFRKSLSPSRLNMKNKIIARYVITIMIDTDTKKENIALRVQPIYQYRFFVTTPN